MRNAARKCEDLLAKLWPLLLGLVLVGAVASCAYTDLVQDPETGDTVLVEKGEDLVPGITVGSDVIGAAKDAAESVDVPEAIEDATSGNWFGLGAAILGALSVFAGGYAARKKLRKKAS